LVMLKHLKTTLDITATRWDLATITASDYTVAYNITLLEYNQFKDSHQNADQSVVYCYMNHLKEKYEPLVSKESAINDETTDIKIADISFAFNNDDIIDLLEARGNAIVSKNFAEKEKVEAEIEHLRTTKGDELSRPVTAYITFETQEGYERAKKMRGDIGQVFSGAPEPTNIIWENLHNHTSNILLRTTIVA